MTAVHDRYIPALRYRALTRFYDPIVALTTREATFKTALVEQVAARPGDQVLDLGCGTGTLTLLLKQGQPGADLVGLDGDLEVLARARQKARRAVAMIDFQSGRAQSLPFPNGQFDRVASSLFFHHLTLDAKRRTLAEILRVLKPGGELHVADWGQARNLPMRLAFLGIQLLDGFETTTDNIRGRLPELMEAAGFCEVRETRQLMTALGPISLYRATRRNPCGPGAAGNN